MIGGFPRAQLPTGDIVSAMNADSALTGVLLIQLGTPDSTSVADVRIYLREFLSDPRVLDIPAPARALLLNAVILPFRPRRSAKAYEKIWTEHGSPLITHTADLTERVQSLLGDQYLVEYGMRYRNPPMSDAFERLAAAGCSRLVILPLFPQYASASGGSAAQEALALAGSQWNIPEVRALGAFFDHPGYLRSVAGVARTLLTEFAPDHVLFSYHGLPERQVRKSDISGGWCLTQDSCCDQLNDANRFCYRAQCYATSRGLAGELDLEPGKHSTTFQSRLAGQKWIRPHTDKELPRLYGQGVRRLAVLTPSFTADCLETIEEIGIRAREQWEGLGGEGFLLVPCVNSTEEWARAVADLVVGV